ncbi:hypothetical protein ADK67_14490 [Saccharothrix sp. NRRL B-16348]|uniref:hypothetical protein n=1 Tax=Saccharothrix sp. NRRL B-16348 TaxID=1415542 RepID=UPI0006AE3148|nr:hypothetical protein [Saccharothrix sp. NRRL B-16348]KOX27038.1 hypothetical protein ADK67_14490 [Saccharothrix sp. NRRL B-16348]
MTDPPAATAPTSREIDAEPHPTRKAVLAAMARMLSGRPNLTRPGLLSKAGLAREAQVDRNHVTQGSLRDLGDRLAALARAHRTPTTSLEAQQQAHIEQLTARLENLTATHAELRLDRDHWKASTHTLLRAVQVLRLEHTTMRADITVLTRRLDTVHDATTGLYVLPPQP